MSCQVQCSVLEKRENSRLEIRWDISTADSFFLQSFSVPGHWLTCVRYRSLVYSAVEGFNEYILGARGSEVVEKHDVRHSWLPLALKLLLQPLLSADLSLYFLF